MASKRQAWRSGLLQSYLPNGLSWATGGAYVDKMEIYKTIDYNHQQHDLPCNGILSNMGGSFEAHWTYDQRGQFTTEQFALPSAAFVLLWDGIAASVSTGGVFCRCLVTDPTRLIDPDLYHVISAVQVQDGRAKHRVFMVPANEADPDFVVWLDGLAVPGNARVVTAMSKRARATHEIRDGILQEA